MKPSVFDLMMLLSACLLAACTTTAPATPTATKVPATVTPTPAPVAIAAQDVQRKVKAGDMERTYSLHIPAGLNNQELVPLVFIFHGYRETSDYVRSMSNFDPIANANGFIAVYPDGSGLSGSSLSWNGGVCCGEAVINKVDETLFVRAILEDVKTFVNVDPKRTYATGSSNGALLSYRLACEMSDTFAAIAPVSGVLGYSPCQPAGPVSVLHVHGIKDTVVPLDGNATFPPVRDGLTTWAKVDGCNGAEKEEQVNKILKRTSFSGCKPGIALELYTSDAMGHGWPSKYVGAILPISEIIWKFFAEHPKP